MEHIRYYFFTIALLSSFLQLAHGQDADSSNPIYHFNGNVSVTNNGFSFIPSFTLGKPATIVNLSVGGERFSFDPQFRFDLDGLKPWSFIFIWRYQLIESERFQLKAGAHLPAIAFSNTTVQVNGDTLDQLTPKRFLTPELMPAYTISKNIIIGMYYIYGIGLETFDQTKHTHFLSLRAYFNQLRLGDQIYINWNPQVYYLYMDGKDGFYTAQSVSLIHRKLPVSLAAMINASLQTELPTKDFDWNISLIYSFKNQLLKK